MRCPNCGKDNPETYRFCVGCGNALKTLESDSSARLPDDCFEKEKTVVLDDMDPFEREETVILDDMDSFEKEETVILDDCDSFEDERTVILSESKPADFGYRNPNPVPVYKEDFRGQNQDLAYIEHLRALKGLLDDGIITEDEFTRKKKQILGI